MILGAQWGDEGKGKIVDLLSDNIDITARYQGGANAGHTIIYENNQYVLHLIPSGIFNNNVICVIGNGVVFDPEAFLKELQMLKNLNIDFKNRILISHNAHLIMPYHKILDRIKENKIDKIGTTGMGIGPAYVDKASRIGIKTLDLLDKKILKEKIKKNLQYYNDLFQKIYNTKPVNENEMISQYEMYASQIEDFITDTSLYLNNAIKSGKRIIAEGAQGTLLDIDHGTYPFVTSSNPTAGGVCIGLGIPPTSITSILGVVKAYCTRVGEGPFPTELNNELGEKIRRIGAEYGATTGRPRRCGWFDAFALKYSIMINGIQKLAVTKLDVLNDFDEIFICTSYEYEGKAIKTFPTDILSLGAITPVYERFEGWKTDISGVKRFEDLPENAIKYLSAIEKYTGVGISIVSVGSKREQTIIVEN
ncbi:MAG: Adenylosuccinate synthetase [Ignavibacteriae bacterium]|nr:MAG: Adenylosuccinate synthetase [Ignavibacteriota bacterium]